MTGRPSLAVCTVIYPGVENYLRDWYTSVRTQTDQDFTLWIALDGLGSTSVARAAGAPMDGVEWLECQPGDSPARIRARILASVVQHHETVVLVDSDDVLCPHRVASARAALANADLAACALRLVDEQGVDLGATLQMAPNEDPDDVLPRHNVFGLSNTAYRSSLLTRCLPVAAEAAVVDWYLATRAWLLRANLVFDPDVGMEYRQHPANMTQVRPPFTRAQVARDTQIVQNHLDIVLRDPPSGSDLARLDRVSEQQREVDRFAHRLLPDVQALDRYVAALNTLEFEPRWWVDVAHPDLSHLWS